MDIRKDIQNNTSLAAISGRGIEATNALVSKKAERLATALYLVTSFLSDNEPMKARLRTLSLELVRDASSVRYGGNVVLETVSLESLRANIAETLSLLELSFVAGLVSEMNFTILKREYHALRDKLELKKASRDSVSDVMLGGTFFGVSDSPSVSVGEKYNVEKKVSADNLATTRETQPPHQKVSQGHSKGHTVSNTSPMSSGVREIRASESFQKGTQPATQKVNTPTSQGHKKDTVVHDIARESRRTRILKLVKDSGEVTIKDISNHFPELSEKTIQRELIAFVDSGVLKREGERRWSRYSLA